MAKIKCKAIAKAKAKSKLATRSKKASVKAREKAKTKKTAQKKTAARKMRPAQKFTVSHCCEEDFDAGLRAYSTYRDLGLTPATSGLVQAHVMRMTKPFDVDEVAFPHYHDVEFQMIHVLKAGSRPSSRARA